jgi:flagellar biosynthesis activator protein FlaF
MTHRAYQTTQQITESPRDSEYRLFGQVTGALIDAQKEHVTGGPLAEAIDWNRRLWRTLASDCMDERNQLPKEVRAQIVSLSLWVSKYSKQVTRQGAPMQPLIEINRTIMQGLSGAA